MSVVVKQWLPNQGYGSEGNGRPVRSGKYVCESAGQCCTEVGLKAEKVQEPCSCLFIEPPYFGIFVARLLPCTVTHLNTTSA